MYKMRRHFVCSREMPRYLSTPENSSFVFFENPSSWQFLDENPLIQMYDKTKQEPLHLNITIYIYCFKSYVHMAHKLLLKLLMFLPENADKSNVAAQYVQNVDAFCAETCNLTGIRLKRVCLFSSLAVPSFSQIIITGKNEFSAYCFL